MEARSKISSGFVWNPRKIETHSIKTFDFERISKYPEFHTISTVFFATAHYTHLAKNAVGSFATFQMEIKTAQIVRFRTNEKIIKQLHHDIRKLPN